MSPLLALCALAASCVGLQTSGYDDRVGPAGGERATVAEGPAAREEGTPAPAEGPIEITVREAIAKTMAEKEKP